MKVYIVVIEASTARGYETKVGETGHTEIETARIELVEKMNAIKANPKPCFGHVCKDGIHTEWITDRYCVLKHALYDDIVNIYIHEINIPEP